MKVIHEKQLVT